MKFLVDMNLSPGWIDMLKQKGVEAVHWSEIGPPDAADSEILNYAREHEYIVFTHDLDFGNILAATGDESPSVIQIRTHDPTPKKSINLLLKAVYQFRERLEEGALVTIDPQKLRARVLPIR